MKTFGTLLLACGALLCAGAAAAQSRSTAERPVPQAVLAQVRQVENDFRRALAQDCAPERCFAKVCVHVAHTVVNAQESHSLPGLNLEPPPGLGDTPGQVHLTSVECSFAHDPSVRAKDAAALAMRLKAKLSRAWTDVDVVYEELPAVRAELSKSPLPDPQVPYPYSPAPAPPEPELKPEPAAEPPAPEPPPLPAWDNAQPSRELWLSLLPHFSWMLGLVLLTFAALILIWAARRLGRMSPEEQLLLSQLAQEGAGTSPSSDAAAAAEVTESEPMKRWRARMEASGQSGKADPALQALVKDLLRHREYAMLAKAALLFPEQLPKAFPADGELANARLALAEYLKEADTDRLPSDEAFFAKLDRHAVSAQLTADADADLLRGLHDDFGARALVQALDVVPARHGALLFAHAAVEMQHEAAELMKPERVASVVDSLMRSNRVDPAETAYLLRLLGALRTGSELPAAPAVDAVSDRGEVFNATAALSILLPRLAPERRNQLVEAVRTQHNGKLPSWLRGILYGKMLLELSPSQRTDILLEVEATQLASWLQVQAQDSRAALLSEAPASLQAALSGARVPSALRERYALAEAGRAALSASLLRRIGPDFAFHTLLG